MRTYLLAALLLAAVFSSNITTCAAQSTPTCVIDGINWCDSTVAIPFEVFPILGFTFGNFGDYDKVNQWKKYGFNGLHAPSDKGLDKSSRFMTKGMVAEERFDAVLDEGYIGHWNFPFRATESRFFLASNEKMLSDAESDIYDYETKRNWHEKTAISIEDFEAFIAPNRQLDSLGYILRDLDCHGEEGSLALDGSQAVGYYTISPHESKAICDFIYRFDPDELALFDSTDTLFEVEYYLYDTVGGNSHEIAKGSSFIRGQDYTSYVWGTHSGEHQGIKLFPDTSRYPGFGGGAAPQQYATVRHIIEWSGITPVRIDCRVRRLRPVGIFVRGLRIRSELADKILRGDSAVVARIKYLADVKKAALQAQTYSGVSSWSKVKNLTAGNEPIAACYRVQAAVDKIVYDRIGKHIIPFLSNNLPRVSNWPWYRVIYEDQNGFPPPATDAENLVLLSNYWNIPYPKDAIKAELYTHPGVVKRRLLTLTGDPNKGSDSTAHPLHSYDTYTEHFQNALDDKGFADAAYAATPSYTNDTSKFKPWRAHLSSVLTIRHPSGLPATDTMRRWLMDKFYGQNGHTQNCSPWGERAWPAVPTDDSEFVADYRSPTVPELRAQLWNAICYGTKGIIFNAVSSDGGNNIGALPLDGEPLDYDLTGTRQILSNVGFGTCEDPLLGPQRYPGEPYRWKDHLIMHTARDTNGNNTTGKHTRFIPIFSDVAFTSGSKVIAVGDPILEEDAHNYVRFLQTHPDPLVRSSAKAEYRDSLEWYARTEYHGTCDTTIWNAYDSALSATHCYVYGELGIYEPVNRYGYQVFKNLPIHINTYFGFLERVKGIHRTVEDVKPIATYLKAGRWRAGLKYSDLHLTGTDAASLKRKSRATASFEYFPILPNIGSDQVDRTSQRVKPDTIWESSSNKFSILSAEEKDSSFYELGLMQDLQDSQAYFFAISNRRTWPVTFYYDSTQNRERIQRIDNSGTAPQALRGAIDVRAFSFKVDRAKINASYTYYSVTNLRTNVERILHHDSIHTVFLEPGEGTLMRIAPARSFIAGKTSTAGMAFNNGHRVAELGVVSNSLTPPTSWKQRIMTWERNGNIDVAIVNNLGEIGEENFLSLPTPVTATLDVSGNAHNPSVAAKLGSNGKDTIMVVWTRDVSGVRRVYYNIGIKDTSGGTSNIAWQSSPTHVANVPIRGSGERPTPVVTPLHRGFFIAWSSFNGFYDPEIHSAFVEVSGSNWIKEENVALRANPTPMKVLFPSVASRNEYLDLDGRRSNRVHLAWEEWIDSNGTGSATKITSQIYYAWFERFYPTVPSDTFQTDVETPFEHAQPVQPFERVSRGHISCRHHHPNIAVKNRWNLINGQRQPEVGRPVVTWEAIDCMEDSSSAVLLRSKETNTQWGTFTSFYRKSNNFTPQPVVRYGDAAPPSFEHQAVVFHDQGLKQVITERFPSVGGWVRSTLYDRGLNASATVPFHAAENQTMNTITFRGALQGEDDLYPARITAKLGGYEKRQATNLAHMVGAFKDVCSKGVAFIIGGGSVGCPECPDPEDTTATNPRKKIDWQVKDLWRDGFDYGSPRSGVANTTGGSGVPWPITEDSIRTNYFPVSAGDNIKYDYAFNISDTAWLGAQFTDSTQFLSFEVVLKDSASHAQVQVIDRFDILKPSGSQSLVIVRPFGSLTSFIPCPGLISTKLTPENEPPALDTLPPSGKGYLTVRSSKDTNSTFDLNHVLEGYESFGDIVPDGEPVIAPKTTTWQSRREAQTLGLFAFPNPFSSVTNIELVGVAEAPTVVELYDVSGQLLQTLYQGVAPANGLLSLQLDRAGIADGSYYIRAVCGGEIVSKRIVVLR